MAATRAPEVDHERLTIVARADWRAWLQQHHATSSGVWVETYKKRSGGPHVPYGDVVEEALCFGWIDCRGGRVDDERSQLLLKPRRPRSNWSPLNKQRVARLAAAGLLAPAGIAAIERAEADGTWDALNEVAQTIEPADLRAALDAEPEARRHWDAFPGSAKRRMLEWIVTAKRPETRARRVGATVHAAARGDRALA
jgi:uncharacterized protein YdeI (YjbR/CyaY-like superfamily)